jgi:hypothetical protein
MVRSGKSKLLFISPFMPCPTGGGSAMRAFNTLPLQALSSCFDVYLLIFSMGLRKPPVLQTEVKKIVLILL